MKQNIYDVDACIIGEVKAEPQGIVPMRTGFALSARRLSGVNYGLQTIAGALSIAFGLWYAYETGISSGLWS